MLHKTQNSKGVVISMDIYDKQFEEWLDYAKKHNIDIWNIYPKGDIVPERSVKGEDAQHPILGNVLVVEDKADADGIISVVDYRYNHPQLVNVLMEDLSFVDTDKDSDMQK